MTVEDAERSILLVYAAVYSHFDPVRMSKTIQFVDILIIDLFHCAPPTERSSEALGFRTSWMEFEPCNSGTGNLAGHRRCNAEIYI